MNKSFVRVGSVLHSAMFLNIVRPYTSTIARCAMQDIWLVPSLVFFLDHRLGTANAQPMRKCCRKFASLSHGMLDPWYHNDMVQKDSRKLQPGRTRTRTDPNSDSQLCPCDYGSQSSSFLGNPCSYSILAQQPCATNTLSSRPVLVRNLTIEILSTHFRFKLKTPRPALVSNL